jgi:hypothetical protein
MSVKRIIFFRNYLQKLALPPRRYRLLNQQRAAGLKGYSDWGEKADTQPR